MIGFLKVCNQREPPTRTLSGHLLHVRAQVCNPPLLTLNRYSDTKPQRLRWVGTSLRSASSSYRL